MADPHPDGGFDLNKDAVGLDLNVPGLEEDAREVQRLPAVEVYLHNPIDWDELQEDLFDLSNPIYFQRFAPYQLIEILLFCQSTWRGVGSATKGTDRLVCRVRFRDPFTSLSGIRVCILLSRLVRSLPRSSLLCPLLHLLTIHSYFPIS